MKKKNYFVHDSTVIDEGVKIGDSTKIWHFSHVSSGAKIGNNCTIGQNVFIGKNVSIGNDVKIQNNVSIFEGVQIEDKVFCGPSVVFTNVINPRSFVSRKKEYKKTIICKGATLGANVTIICGVNIGSFSMIGAGAVLTKSSKPHSLMYGNPATHKGWVSESGEILDSELYCSRENIQYKLINNILKKSNG